ncbi:MAG: HAD family hydrolase [Promethearchaeota archaeon]
MKIKALVWDLDGTLIYFKINYIKARRVSIKILRNYGINKQELSIQKSILENVNRAKEIFKKIGYSPKKIQNILNEVNNEVIKIEHEAAIKATKIEGIEQVLRYAKEKNLKQAIFTFNTNKNAKLSLKKVNLLNFFDVIAGRDDVVKPKPHPEHLNYICKKLNVKPSEIIVIGDNYRDIEGAKSVNSKSIAVLTTNIDRDLLIKADFIVKQKEIPNKLIEIIEQML